MHQRRDPSAERAWCLYDWGNSGFATVCMTAVLPPYLAALVNAERGAPAGTVLWGWVAAAGLLLGVLLGPPLGTIADARGVRRRFLAVFAGVGVVATGLLALALPGSWPVAAMLYVVAATGFAGANLFYDALLPGLAPSRFWDEISARGYAWGYLGGGLVLLAAAGLALGYGDLGVRGSFVLVAVWWGGFTIPVLHRVPEPPASPGGAWWQRLAITLRDARQQPMLWRFLLAYWLYNDGIGTIIKMAGAYGAELGIPLSHMLGALVLTQFIGVPATTAFGRLGTRWGARRGILLALGGYVVIAAFGYFLRETWHFWVLAGAVGLVQGGSQALSRSLYARLVPPAREAEFFSFLDLSGRAAGIAGPILFALVTGATGTGRAGILAVIAFFLAGGWLLVGVRVPEPGVEHL